jgi:hypothetical protein
MPIRLLARDLYRAQQEVDRLERQLAEAPAGRREELLAGLRRARSERDRLRGFLDGQKDSPKRPR